ncbi:bifunctional phosphoribosyl-AMP cyclohydrolase/phosphoribosyl-ATP diphosphatase HisIE [Aceticella autotrophica]|uniref:Histidine biosynthesis bifunctional protein HisIE n=1 Tax=Aceticella autotrophica TaxID=2755338 RepID=A0A975AV40_9THEO|nr:bifunctional phosphoribosyl-AMP cyclohydrolase/phosphoribosyl-ATP diphosphatase HisIE [Aceticella autotrophica]QSZ27019.1 bifunctional phosphoribosyl-AMP cyclohydrolase/phosphoribosyl-ATP diphosphatase HisIE [Aceticella autotrophica]
MLKFDERGLIPAIIQDCKTKEVLMMAYMNEESLKLTLEKGETFFFSRSRKKLWHKGETSGNIQKVKKISYDCDEDTLLIEVEAAGPACHTGHISCFYRDILNIENDNIANILEKVYQRIKDRKENPLEGSYTNYLFDKGINKILKKIGEESTEIVIAAKEDSKEEIIYETADLLYHIMVMMVEKDILFQDIYTELAKRFNAPEEFKKEHKKKKEASE